MIIFLFVYQAFSKWLNFSLDEFDKYVEDSIYHPIFVLCYSPFCPHCTGLPEELKQYSEDLGKSDDIYYTTVNCQEPGLCQYFDVKGTPKILLVQGPNKRYWPIVRNNTVAGWDNFIKERTSPNFRQIITDDELENSKLEPKSGGTLFYLESSSEKDPAISKVRDLSSNFRSFNDSFVYRITGQTKLTAFTSKYCGYVYKGDFQDHSNSNNNKNNPESSESLGNFVNEYKFGLFHKYFHDEYLELISKRKSAIIVNDGKLSDSQKHSLQEISKNHCSIAYGWMSINEDTQILKLSKKKFIDSPFLFMSDIKAGIECIYKRRMRGPQIHKALTGFEKGQCISESSSKLSEIKLSFSSNETQNSFIDENPILNAFKLLNIQPELNLYVVCGCLSVNLLVVILVFCLRKSKPKSSLKVE
ncbi:hypothetical protein TRFO_10858 [Tritrichomonas foetus]|uniref:protein disulfide-isomerase n=1 Tax=Tritrichomonas foetus TaxID=1144522 RepID=A0A1J4JCB6_9EUKA|nr:hypothetical protein TRFO_10858 [Tritrichomonas foetus]|eukprot:OHS94908.1 hypothetical protein TRFO_10858 [Tritrichomonas foetus]